MALSIGELIGYVDLDMGGAESSVDRLDGVLEKSSRGWAKIMGGGALAAGAAFSASLMGAMNLEPSRDRVAAALDLTAEQAERAGKVSGQLFSEAWGESASEVDGAVEAVISSIKGMRNASDRELKKATTGALTFASTFQLDVTRAVQVAGGMITNGLAKNATSAFDQLSATLSKVPVQLREDILDATDEYGQFFKQLGYDGPTAMGLLAQGAKKGMYGIDKAGDAVKEFTIRSTDMSAASKDAYESMGMNAGNMANSILAGGGKARKATEQIIAGILKIKDPAKQAETAIALFGTPLEDLSTKDIPKFLRSLTGGEKVLGKWQGTTKRMGDTLNDNAKTNLTQFTRSLQKGFVDMIGGKVLPKVTELTGALNQGLGPALSTISDAVSATTGFLSEHKGVAIALGSTIAVLTALTVAHGAVLAVAAAGGMAAWLRSTVLISTATKVWAAVQWAMNAAMAANPVVLAVVAIAALVAAVIWVATKTEWGRKAVAAAWNGIKTAAAAVGKWFTDTLPSAFSAAWNKIKSVFMGAVNGVVGFLKKNWPTILAVLTGPIGLAVLAIAKNWDKIKSGASGVVSWIRGIPGKIGALGASFGKAGRNLLQGFIDGMKNAAGVISGIAGNVWNAVKGMLNGAIDKINRALEFKISLPGPDININPPDIPKLATGGRATSATLAVIGEGREPESVLPDSVLRGLLERARDAGRDSALADPARRDGPLVGTVVQAPDESAERFTERLWFLTHTRG